MLLFYAFCLIFYFIIFYCFIMTNVKNPVVLCEEDHRRLTQLIGNINRNDATNEMSLAYEISRAIVVKDNAFPPDTIRISSSVLVIDTLTGKETAFTIVMPEQANMKEKKISVLTPMSAALIGFKTGDEVTWKMPAGLKHFKVLKVVNE